VTFLALYFSIWIANFLSNGFYANEAYYRIEFEEEAYYLEQLKNLKKRNIYN